ncbi:hypothetical protein DSAG12_00141 [Promethearchaeum syntrophicum]|uniref:C1q domain protein n=1 Tax=Promethearchaeum syntrophicum TaxID=2594042 RepID=A0A5B9D5D9_9ARCH|nr:hypothetical protein [Candidatus Prometheoarchaeum syntrophicum]QEE14328.1 hypothetical protein DSAG12_00141 [Candidatus Prometheoarchaeum syntrophicum]
MSKIKIGKGLAIITLLLGLIGSGTGGYLFAKEFFLDVEPQEEHILPKARVFYNGTPSFSKYSNTVAESLDFNQVSYDTHNAFDLTNDSYIIPEDGVYDIDAQYCVANAEDGDDYVIFIMLDTQRAAFKQVTCSATVSTLGVSISDKLNLTVGDTISIHIFVFTGVSEWRSVYGKEYATFFSIAKLA